MNFTRYVQAIHLPSENRKSMNISSNYCNTKTNLPCDETARDLAKSILLPIRMQHLDFNKSKSCNNVKKYSALVNEALSTTE